MNSKTLLPYLLLLPATLFLLVFFAYPFVQVALQAFETPTGLGVGNFQTILRNFRFWPSVRNTMLLAVIVVLLQLIMALVMASVVASLNTARSTVLYIFTIPLGLSDLAAGLIWLAIFEQSGFLNSMLVWLGVVQKPILLLSYQNTGVLFTAVILAELWRALQHDPRYRGRTSLVVLCDLVARGVPQGTATGAILSAVRAGGTDRDLLRMREHVHAQIQHGQAPAGAAQKGLRELLERRPGAREQASGTARRTP